MTSQQQPKVWFVTGSSTGLGRCLVEYLLNKSEIVVATLRKPDVLADLRAKYSTTQLLILPLDVTNKSEVDAAFDQVKAVFGRLDVVVNNAGWAMMGEVEDAPEDVARSLFDCNFWAAAYISTKAVKFFREVNKPGVGGRLINVSSVTGLHPFPTTAYYCASKYALEALTQALAAELDPEWKIKVTLVEPGHTETSVTNNTKEAPIHPAYNKPGLPSVDFRKIVAERKPGGGGDPKKLVAKWYELAQLADPPMRLPLGQDALYMARAQIAALTKNLDEVEGWSADLTFDKE